MSALNKFIQDIYKTNPQRLFFLSLGNPGSQYNNTRHNAGHEALSYILNQCGDTDIVFSNKNLIVQRHRDLPIYFGRSLTYMNTSVKAFDAIPSALAPFTLVVVHDDLDTPLGEVKFKMPSVQTGAHGGLTSLQTRIKYPYMRMKVGIGKPVRREKGHVAKYVLSKYSPAEKELFLSKTLPKAYETVEKIEPAMRKWNKANSS